MGINNQYNYYKSEEEHFGMNFRRFLPTHGIYKITNITNNKVYIGYALNVKVRCKCHRVDLRANKHRNCHLQNAWNTYGETAFEFTVLEYCSKKELTTKEDYYCKYFNAHNDDFGYNIKPTGKELYNHSESTKLKISIANKGKKRYKEDNPFYGKKHTQESIEKMLKTKKGTHSLNALKAWETKRKNGYVPSEETRAKLKKAAKNKKFYTGRKVIHVESQTIFDSVKLAAIHANIGTDSMIDRLKGRTKSKLNIYKYYDNGL